MAGTTHTIVLGFKVCKLMWPWWYRWQVKPQARFCTFCGYIYICVQCLPLINWYLVGQLIHRLLVLRQLASFPGPLTYMDLEQNLPPEGTRKSITPWLS